MSTKIYLLLDHDQFGRNPSHTHDQNKTHRWVTSSNDEDGDAVAKTAKANEAAKPSTTPRDMTLICFRVEKLFMDSLVAIPS